VLFLGSCRGAAARGSHESVDRARVWGWPPLGGQYHETLAVTEAQAARGEGLPYVTYYRSLRDWTNERASKA